MPVLAIINADAGPGKTFNVLPGYVVNDGSGGNNYHDSTPPSISRVITQGVTAGDVQALNAIDSLD